MRKVHEIWDIMHFLPWDWFPLFPVFGEFFDTRLFSGDDAVAAHAFAGRWYTSHFAASAIGVTVETVDLVDRGMYVVGELNRLFDILTRIFPPWS